MRQAGTLSNENDAGRLSDYLLTQGIGTRVEKDDDGWILWVFDEDKLDDVRKELDAFRSNPADPRYENLGTEAERIRRQIQKENEQAERNLIQVRKRWAGTRLTWRQAPVTISIIVFCALVFFTQRFFEPYFFISQYKSGLPEIMSGQVWRLITPIFMHGGLMHIIFNLIIFWQLGSLIELRRGWKALIPLIVVSAVVSNLTQYFVSGPLFLGISGVIFALFGYCWMKSRFDPSAGIHLNPRFVMFVLIFLVACFTPIIPLLLGAGIANGAHVGGLAVGIVFGYAPILFRKIR